MDKKVLLDLPDRKLAIEYLYCVENHYTMTFKVKSKGFSGESNFCIPKDTLTGVLNKLKSMSQNLSGSVQIRDIDSDALINLEMMKLGKLEVSGQIGGSHEDHYMQFKFKSDQTLLISFVRFIKSIL